MSEARAAARAAPVRFAAGACASVVLAPLLAAWNALVNRGAEPIGDGVFVRTRARLPILPQFTAITVGHVIYVRGAPDLASAAGARLLRHERAHVRQFERHGWWGMCWRYGAMLCACGYDAHPMEREARRAEADPLTVPTVPTGPARPAGPMAG